MHAAPRNIWTKPQTDCFQPPDLPKLTIPHCGETCSHGRLVETRAEGEGEDVTAAQIVGLLSAVSGAVGTLFLFFGSFAYEQLSPYSNPEIIRDMAKRNKRRQFRQRIGLGLLMLSFVLAGISVVLN
jgi:hypothetical protein